MHYQNPATQLTPNKNRGHNFNENNIDRYTSQPDLLNRNNFNPIGNSYISKDSTNYKNQPSTNAPTYITQDSPQAPNRINPTVTRIIKSPENQTITRMGNIFNTIGSPSSFDNTQNLHNSTQYGIKPNQSILQSPGSPTISRVAQVMNNAKPYNFSQMDQEENDLKDAYIKKLEEENSYLKAMMDKDKNEKLELEFKLKNLEHTINELRNVQTYRSQELNRRQMNDPLTVNEIDRLHSEIENLWLKNNELQLDLAKVSLLNTNNGDIDRKNKYLKDDNAALRDQIRDKEREINDVKNAFNDLLDKNNQYYGQYGSPSNIPVNKKYDQEDDSKVIKQTSEFIMKLQQQLYASLGNKFEAERNKEEELAAKRLSDYLQDIHTNDRLMSKGLSMEHQGIIKSDHDVVVNALLRNNKHSPIVTDIGTRFNQLASPGVKYESSPNRLVSPLNIPRNDEYLIKPQIQTQDGKVFIPETTQQAGRQINNITLEDYTMRMIDGKMCKVFKASGPSTTNLNPDKKYSSIVNSPTMSPGAVTEYQHSQPIFNTVNSPNAYYSNGSQQLVKKPSSQIQNQFIQAANSTNQPNRSSYPQNISAVGKDPRIVTPTRTIGHSFASTVQTTPPMNGAVFRNSYNNYPSNTDQRNYIRDENVPNTHILDRSRSRSQEDLWKFANANNGF